MGWRPTLFKLHRDAGFLALGLTLVYAVSGVAVNHKGDWNYNQSAQVTTYQVGRPAEILEGLDEARRAVLARDPGQLSRDEEPAVVRRLSAAVGEGRAAKNAFWRGPARFSVFFETGDRDTVDYDPATGIAVRTRLEDRPVFRSLNFLHLNEGRRWWTWVADGYAVVLAFLAITGVVMVKGRKGLIGRGGVLMLLGVLVPLAGLLLFRWMH